MLWTILWDDTLWCTYSISTWISFRYSRDNHMKLPGVLAMSCLLWISWQKCTMLNRLIGSNVGGGNCCGKDLEKIALLVSGYVSSSSTFLLFLIHLNAIWCLYQRKYFKITFILFNMTLSSKEHVIIKCLKPSNTLNISWLMNTQYVAI